MWVDFNYTLSVIGVSLFVLLGWVYIFKLTIPIIIDYLDFKVFKVFEVMVDETGVKYYSVLECTRLSNKGGYVEAFNDKEKAIELADKLNRKHKLKKKRQGYKKRVR